MNTPATSTDVIVVGLGPVGAALAGLLGQGGHRVTVIERAEEVYPLPRAAHFDHEIMRVFQQLGLAAAVLEHSRPAGAYEFRNAAGELLMSARRGEEEGPSGWAHSYMFNQPGVERALRARLDELPNVSVLLGHEFRSLTQHEGHVEIIATGRHDEEVALRATFVVGCDGAWSPVREALRIPLEDYQFDEPWLVVDTIPNSPVHLPTINLQICDPRRPTTCVLMGPGRHRWEFMLLPGEDSETALQPGFAERLLATWKVDVAVERKAVYRFHGLIATQWRDRRVLIAGDAAHQMPPFAGQGMCSGIRDAANLAWKLSSVLRDGASEALLDTYQAERERSVRDYIELAIEMGRVVCTLDPAMATLRDAQMIAALKQGDRTPPPPGGGPGKIGGAFLSGDRAAGTIFPQPVAADGSRLDDTLGQGAWLIHARGGNGSGSLASVSIDDPLIAPFRERLEAWLVNRGADAVLVRPDRYVFGTGSARELQQAWLATMATAEPTRSVA